MERIVTSSVGEKLRQAREKEKLSQSQVAEMVGCTREYISMIESGKRMPKISMLKRLATIYKVDIHWLLEGGEEPEIDTFSMLLRAPEVKEIDKKAIREFVKYCEDYAWLEEKLGIKKHEMSEQRRQVPTNWREMQIQAKRLAKEERGRLQLGDGPIRDIFSLLENQGLHVIRILMHKNSPLDGAFAYDPEKGAFILVNASRTRGKQAFTAAHEYCHYLRDRTRGYRPCKIDEDYLSRIQQHKDVERFADLFATHFLMPEEGVRRIVDEQFGIGYALRAEEVIYLKRYFGVSYSAMLIRLLELEYISREAYEQLKSISVEKLERTLYGDEAEEKPLEPPKVPPMLVVLALEAYSRGFITLTRLAEIWRMRPPEVREILRSAGYDIRG
ncbi:MAG: XRE family transcriptional regulator [Armatimonadota bacterium]|nr:XRE family transcriptional regulator [Armatimonadota bacterium]MDW8025311.1 XRE family transcriptional regulator [Armatimonadota bacterium]